jgi:hypothetical protein
MNKSKHLFMFNFFFVKIGFLYKLFLCGMKKGSQGQHAQIRSWLPILVFLIHIIFLPILTLNYIWHSFQNVYFSITLFFNFTVLIYINILIVPLDFHLNFIFFYTHLMYWFVFMKKHFLHLFVFLVLLELELRVSHLLSSHSTT